MRKTRVELKNCNSPIRTQNYEEANVSIWGEVLFAAEVVLLHATPLYYGLGIRTVTAPLWFSYLLFFAPMLT